jgi:sugar phosphate isomerase/epimerase
MTKTIAFLSACAVGLLAAGPAAAEPPLFAKPNLVAWCLVPFDASQRGPEARAEMLQELGFTKFAYDWRDQHVPEFEAEILALKARGIELFAFWNEHESMFSLFEKHGIHPQVWKTAPSPKDGTQEERIEAAARQLLPLVERTRALGCKLGLYNHGGWGGEPENLVAVCLWLRDNADAQHVGIVYNFHHAHDRVADFAANLALMKPYLLCLNLNGMKVPEGSDKVLPIGSGEHEKGMIQSVLDSGYAGPIGILDHRNEVDAEESLRANLDGLEQVLAELK